MNAVRLIVFSLVVPGFVTGYIPYTIYNKDQVFNIGALRYLGWVFILGGVLLYTWSALNFLLMGKGTPALWLTKKLEFLIGKEPVELVSNGLYRFSRNPMYLGVLSIVFGLSFLLESRTILYYVLILGLFFHLVVIFLEEPHLKRKYGKDYESYLRRTKRWIGMNRIWKKSNHHS